MREASTNRLGSAPIDDIALITCGDPTRLTGGYLYNKHVLDSLRGAGLAVRQMVLPEGRPLAATLSLQRSFIRRTPNLVIIDSIALVPAAILAPWLKRHLAVQVVPLMHMHPSDLAMALQRPLTRYLEARLLSTADHIVAVTHDLKQRFIAAGISAQRITVIMPGRDGVTSAQLGVMSNAAIHFLCVANWSKTKAIEAVVESLALLDEHLHLDLVGEQGNSAYTRHVLSSIDRLGLQERVHLYGPLQEEALARCYLAADVFVLPSISEAFGTVCAEAMTFGLPVIACRIGGLPWLVEPGCGLLVPPGDNKALTEAMRMLGADAHLRQQMGAAALRRSQQLPTWRETGEQFHRLLLSLLHGQV